MAQMTFQHLLDQFERAVMQQAVAISTHQETSPYTVSQLTAMRRKLCEINASTKGGTASTALGLDVHDVDQNAIFRTQSEYRPAA